MLIKTYKPLHRIPMLLDSTNCESVTTTMSFLFNQEEIVTFNKCLWAPGEVDFTPFSKVTAKRMPDGLSFEQFYCALHNARFKNFLAFFQQVKNVRFSVTRMVLLELSEWMAAYFAVDKTMGDALVKFMNRVSSSPYKDGRSFIRTFQANVITADREEFKVFLEYFASIQPIVYTNPMQWGDGKNEALNQEFRDTLENFKTVDVPKFLTIKSNNINWIK